MIGLFGVVVCLGTAIVFLIKGNVEIGAIYLGLTALFDICFHAFSINASVSKLKDLYSKWVKGEFERQMAEKTVAAIMQGVKKSQEERIDDGK